jgi:hypothetical protein
MCVIKEERALETSGFYVLWRGTYDVGCGRGCSWLHHSRALTLVVENGESKCQAQKVRWSCKSIRSRILLGSGFVVCGVVSQMAVWGLCVKG